MKLTERQIALRSSFRKAVINCWHKNSSFNYLALLVAFEVDGYVKNPDELKNYTYTNKILAELKEIPSVGYINKNVMRYLASAYPAISFALFNGASKERALAMFNGLKRKNIRESIIGENEMKILRKAKKKNKAHAILQTNMHGSRYSSSHWGIVK